MKIEEINDGDGNKRFVINADEAEFKLLRFACYVAPLGRNSKTVFCIDGKSFRDIINDIRCFECKKGAAE